MTNAANDEIIVTNAADHETGVGSGGDLHQVSSADGETLTKQQSFAAVYEQNMLRLGARSCVYRSERVL